MTLDDDAAEFCGRVGPQLIGLLTLQCGDRYVAEDLAQQTLARICLRWQRLQHVDDLRAYAIRVALNAAASYFRRRAAERRAYRRAVVRDPKPPDPVSGLLVRQAVADLPPRQRQAILLRYFADLSVRETADVMGCAQGTVKASTAKGIAALRASGLGIEEHANHE